MMDESRLELDPFAQFARWYAEAEKSEPNDPNAMTLATADASGVPSARIVLMRGFDARGFSFFTNFESRKGVELLTNPRAALLFHWKSLRRQVRIEGAVSQVPAEEADAYFASRPRGSRVGAWASQQSRPLASRAELERRIAAFDAQHPGDAVPRPPYWSGFRVTPSLFEFWQDREFRLHDRFVYRREGESWAVQRLYP